MVLEVCKKIERTEMVIEILGYQYLLLNSVAKYSNLEYSVEYKADAIFE